MVREGRYETQCREPVMNLVDAGRALPVQISKHERKDLSSEMGLAYNPQG